MNTEQIAAIFNAVYTIIARHYEQTGQIISNDDAKAMLDKEMSEGYNTIGDWFVANGLTPPQ